MEFAKGDRVVLTKGVGNYRAGAKGRVILADSAFFAADRYNVLLDEDGEVLEQLTDSDLFKIDPEPN